MDKGQTCRQLRWQHIQEDEIEMIKPTVMTSENMVLRNERTVVLDLFERSRSSIEFWPLKVTRIMINQSNLQLQQTLDTFFAHQNQEFHSQQQQTTKAWSGPGSWSPKHFMPGRLVSGFWLGGPGASSHVAYGIFWLLCFGSTSLGKQSTPGWQVHF